MKQFSQGLDSSKKDSKLRVGRAERGISPSMPNRSTCLDKLHQFLGF